MQAGSGCSWRSASVFSLALVDRRWMVWILHKIPRTRDASSDLVPPQRAILLTYLAALVTIATLGIGYLIVLGSFGAVDDPWLVVSGFAIAWLVGFLLVPLPSGLGAREAVLVAILHGTFPSSVLVAASVYQRVVLIATEGLLALIASHRVRPVASALDHRRGGRSRTGRPQLNRRLPSSSR